MKFVFTKFAPALCLTLLTALSLPAAVSAETRYISDRIHVPLRSGESIRHRIVHRGLPSGTKLELVSESEETGYSKVRTNSGLEGYIQTQYLVSKPVARIQLIGAKKELAAIKSRNDALEEKLKAAQASDENTELKVQQLQAENSELSKELEKIKRISANAVKLNSDNKTLVESNQRLKDQVDVLKTDNARLRSQYENDEFLNGAFAVVIGVLITLLVPRLWPKRKSEWG